MTAPDSREQDLSATGDLAPSVVPEVPLEASEADVLEQAADAGTAPHRVDRELPLEAPEADAAEQAEVVPFDDDDRPV
ncbi:MAG: hypothetical protein JWM64_3017 [Frankiales bacterium]|nr:hypothetical protein [Frankiales bacterium]